MYDNIRADIYGVFDSALFKATLIKVIPDTLQIEVGSAPVARLSIIPGSSKFTSFAYKQKQVTGYVILQIFVKTDKGHRELFNIADTLDTFLESKRLTRGTHFESSSLDVKGVDPHDSSLYRGDYMIKFNYFGE